MKNKQLVSLTSQAGSGKDSLSLFVAKEYGYIPTKFSQPVKNLTTKFLGRNLDMSVDREMIIDISFYLKGQSSYVEMRDKYGERLLDFIHSWVYDIPLAAPMTPWTERFWADFTLESLETEKSYVFTDVRLNSEYNALKDLGAVFVFLDCPQKIREERLIARDGGFMEGIWDSPFEKEMLNWEYDIILDASKPLEEVQKEFVEKFNALN